MNRRRLGKSGLVVSEICMGTMTFGSMADEATGLAIMDRAFDAGVNFIDTAEMYPVPPRAKWAGRTEEICAVERWDSGSNSRRLSTRWSPNSTRQPAELKSGKTSTMPPRTANSPGADETGARS